MCDKKERIVGFYSNIRSVNNQTRPLVEKSMPCDYVLLSVWNVENNNNDTSIAEGVPGAGYAEDNREIFWGFDNNPVHQLFPMQTSNFLIPVKDARDIFIRASKATGLEISVAFSLFRKETVDA